MSKLILCSGARTKIPYCFASTGVKVFSIEELCYYIFHHVYMIEEDIYSEALIDWIQTELLLSERAERLRQLKRQNADIKTMVTFILCSADYYTEAEIKGLLKKLDEIISMPKVKRSCIKADHCLEEGQYREASSEYEKILGSEEAKELLPEDYGDILHNLAVAKVHTVGLKEAAQLFMQAYERNRREESLLQYLSSLQLLDHEVLYREKLEEYQVREELQRKLEQYLEQQREEAENSQLMADIHFLRQKKEKGQMLEYYKRTEELLELWKTEVRQK